MIQIRREGDQIIVNVSVVHRPTLYFDQFALYQFASDSVLRDRFLRTFAKRGELMFSHTNMMEVGALRGASAARMREFLSAIGVRWIPLEFDATKVVIGENDPTPGQPHAALSGGLLDFVYRSGVFDQPITLDRIIDEFEKDNPEVHRRFLDNAKAVMAGHVREWQKLTADAMEKAFPIVRRAGPTLYLLSRIIRAIVQEAKSHKWVPNDAFDFVHALVPLVYAEAVFLDKQWKARIARLKLEGPFARVFYGNETDAFFQWFEGFTE